MSYTMWNSQQLVGSGEVTVQQDGVLKVNGTVLLVWGLQRRICSSTREWSWKVQDFPSTCQCQEMWPGNVTIMWPGKILRRRGEEHNIHTRYLRTFLSCWRILESKNSALLFEEGTVGGEMLVYSHVSKYKVSRPTDRLWQTSFVSSESWPLICTE